jgi:hypothetical protein
MVGPYPTVVPRDSRCAYVASHILSVHCGILMVDMEFSNNAHKLAFHMLKKNTFTHQPCYWVWQAALILSNLPRELVGDPIPVERIYDCVNVILSYQVRLSLYGWNPSIHMVLHIDWNPLICYNLQDFSQGTLGGYSICFSFFILSSLVVHGCFAECTWRVSYLWTHPILCLAGG